MTEKENAARELFEAGYNCAQSVAGVFATEMELSRECALELSTGFGAGFARLRETCGAVSGMVLVVSRVLQHGQLRPENKKEVYTEVQQLIRAFEEENGSYICRELLGLRAGQQDAPVPEKRDAHYYAVRPCLNMVLCAVRLTENWLSRRSFQPLQGNGLTALDEAWYAAHRPIRPAQGHKGTFGSLLAVCGSSAYRGAAALCCEAALRSGAGLVALAAAEPVCSAVAARLPEVTFLPLTLPENTSGALAAPNTPTLLKVLESRQALVMGCGLGQASQTAEAVLTLARLAPCPAVLDADALNVLAPQLSLLKDAVAPRILTPHPGEMARLCGVSVQEICGDLVGWAARAAQKWNCIVVLKSSETVVAGTEGQLLVLNRANSGLGKGGSGDVLAGLIGGLLAQGLSPFDAAACGVWQHSAAAVQAAQQRGEAAMLPTDILALL